MSKREFKIWFRPYGNPEATEYDGKVYTRAVAKSLAERLRLKPEYADMKVYVRKAPMTAGEAFNPAAGSNATADQMAAVMLLNGTPEQQGEAMSHVANVAKDNSNG